MNINNFIMAAFTIYKEKSFDKILPKVCGLKIEGFFKAVMKLTAKTYVIKDIIGRYKSEYSILYFTCISLVLTVLAGFSFKKGKNR